MNKKGFTIVELMAVLIIIAILATLVIGGVTRYVNKGKDSYYDSLKNQISLAGKSYYSDNLNERPTGQINENGDKVIGAKLYVDDLLDEDYLVNDVVGANNEDCSESYLVVRLIDGSYKYDVCLICDGIAYDDKETGICEIDDSELVIENSNNIIIDVEDTNVPTCDIDVYKNTTSDSITLEIKTTSRSLVSSPYSFDGVNYTTTNTKEITTNGTYTAYVKGKYGTGTCSVAITDLDSEGPTIAISKTGGVGTATISATISDPSGVESYAITTSTTTPTAWTNVSNSPTSTTKSFTKTSAGTYYIHAKDTVGNTSYVDVTLSLSGNSSCGCQTAATCCWPVTVIVVGGDGGSYKDTRCGANEKKCGCATYNSCYLS